MNDTFPILLSERLQLRQVVSSDAPTVLKGYSDVRVNQHMSVSYHTLEEVNVQLKWYYELFNEKTGIWWGICLKDSGEMIGNGGFHLWNKIHRNAEMGYWILPEFQKKGYASEAIREMMRYGFDHMNLHRIEAIVETENGPSSKLLKDAGFVLDGIRRDCEFVRNNFISLEIWSRLSSDG